MHGSEFDRPGGANLCTGCGRSYASTQWSTLDLVKRVDADELVSFARPWPEHVAVEARACRTCGRALSRLVRIHAAGDAPGPHRPCFATKRV